MPTKTYKRENMKYEQFILIGQIDVESQLAMISTKILDGSD